MGQHEEGRLLKPSSALMFACLGGFLARKPRGSVLLDPVDPGFGCRSASSHLLLFYVEGCTFGLQGSILMDGVDLLTLGLQEVRGRIAAIPQVRLIIVTNVCRGQICLSEFHLRMRKTVHW